MIKEIKASRNFGKYKMFMLISVNINIGLVVMECARGTRMSILKISPFTLKKPVPATQARL